MPTILRIKGYRFWFYEAYLDEPPHVQVGKQSGEAKYWLNPVGLAKSRGFREQELTEIQKLVEERLGDISAAWRKDEVKRGHSKG